MKMARQNKGYFDEHKESYAEEITAIQPLFYENTANLINPVLIGSKKVLDIGNGGVINYNFKDIEKLICADLVVSQQAVSKYAAFKNIDFIEADVLNLQSFTNDVFDVVIIQALIHHLAGYTLKKTHINVEKAVSECMRVLKPEGKLLIVESTVNRPFEFVERLTYPLMQIFFRICKFDKVYQYSEKSLLKRLSKWPIEEHCSIEVGPYIWIMGKKIPTFLTPCGASWFKIVKSRIVSR